MATETVEITTMIGSLCTCASLRVWESVVACFGHVVRKPFGFGVGQTDSKYAQNSDSRALATAKRCSWHFGSDGGLQSGSSPLSKEVARAKTSDDKKGNIAKL